jgi:hypothetical protein
VRILDCIEKGECRAAYQLRVGFLTLDELGEFRFQPGCPQHFASEEIARKYSERYYGGNCEIVEANLAWDFNSILVPF